MEKNTSNNTPTDYEILKELEPVAEKALQNHINNKDTKEWLPYQHVPFEKVEEKPVLDSATKSAIYINGLTEDNLAHYTSTLKRLFGREGAWGEWNNRWTWEESLHGRVIERYIDHIDIFDKFWLESARKAQITSGDVPEPNNIAEISIYTSIQEELTRLAHSRLSQRLHGVGRKIFALIAGDELRHHHFYNSVAVSIRERFPDEFVKSLHSITRRFDMPGLSIPGFKEHSEDIERAGIFTTQDVARTIGKISLESWDIDTLGDDVVQEDSKVLVAKIQKRLATYKRLSDIAIEKTKETQPQIEWFNGRPVFS
jgi:acyl-[acyl-carrier-protein] desaturase